MTPQERAEQRMKSLERANDVRVPNAALKREIKALRMSDGWLEVAALIEDNAWPSNRLAPMTWLMTVRGAQQRVVMDMLRSSGIYDTQLRIEGLSQRARVALATTVRLRATGKREYGGRRRSAVAS